MPATAAASAARTGAAPEGASAAIADVIRSPAGSAAMDKLGVEVDVNSPQEFAAQIKAEYEVYKKVVDQQKLKLD